MNMRLRLMMALVPSLAGLLLFLNALGASGAAPLASWSLHDRANATTFATGSVIGVPPAAGKGYEIVSFAAVPVSTGLATYVYGGADLPPARGQVAAAVACDAQVSTTAASLVVDGAYPYAGCVFYLGVTNSGDAPMDLALGPADPSLIIQCGYPGCESDIDILAGGADSATVDALCTTTGGVTHVGGLVYQLAPGATMACPLFIVVQQEAHQGSEWTVTTPGQIAPPVAGVSETPVPPGTGTGLRVTPGSPGAVQHALFAVALGLLLVGPLGFWLLWRRPSTRER